MTERGRAGPGWGRIGCSRCWWWATPRWARPRWCSATPTTASTGTTNPPWGVVQWSESETVRLQLWDIAGQERFTSMTRLYYREASACVIMFDVTNASTFSNSHRWKQDLDSKVVLPDGSAVPCLLLANKCDLSPWAVTRDEIDRFSKENGFAGWVETSVKENKNIHEAMRVLIEKMMSSCTGGGSPCSAGSGDYISIQESSAPGWACC
ncbi:ras-related protein Rab-7L1 isoform X2 [Passer montanus]|uniref:ras-related protein Rab-7L1 isoform X1 n=1 Tax=Passer montanus TaxID=9160 RepID=UPI0019600355|nr:ras-related protein Rab-7L1 isoform X1 [Passer montanus]XP_039555300.1 ras-related protein Rab-7L1 isoform X2 [Passer montanus]